MSKSFVELILLLLKSLSFITHNSHKKINRKSEEVSLGPNLNESKNESHTFLQRDGSVDYKCGAMRRMSEYCLHNVVTSFVIFVDDW